MRIIDDWQYRYIEKCLYSYNKLVDSELETEKNMVVAINEAINFFSGTSHEIMMVNFYFEADQYRKRLKNSAHHTYVCEDMLHTEVANGYVIRREIIYRIAMNCYAVGVFKI